MAFICRPATLSGTACRRSYWFGKFGDAQVGPIYLGTIGFWSLLCGIIAIEIIGLNMWASVNWDPVQFVRRLPYLSLEPPAAKYGLHIPPMKEGGWWLIWLLPDHINPAVVGTDVSPGSCAWHGHACCLGVCCSDLAVSGSRLHPARC